MTKRRLMLAMSVAFALVAGLWGIQTVSAQIPGFKRTELQKHDLSTTGHEAVVAKGEFEPGAAIPKHTHPGEEAAYIIEGELTLEVDGKPPQNLKAGDSYFVPAGTVHAAKAKTKTVVISTYIVEKGKPLASMVGAPAAPAPAKK
jgi:quercetin dioxygenase-like cupin family protein